MNFGEFDPVNAGTSLKFGPDGRLYVSELNGIIKVYTVDRSSPNEYTVIAEEVISSIKSIPNHDDNGLLAFDKRGNRQITGLTVVGTASNPVIYVTSSDPKWGGPNGDKGLDTNSAIISKISWNGLSWETVDLVRGLPRSEENHSINGIEFTTILGKPYLLVAIGGFTNAGSPSKNFAYITEYALSAAIIRVDLDALGNLPTKTDPVSGRMYIYDVPTLDDPSRPNINGIYDPNNPGYNGIDVNDPFGGNNGLNMGMLVEGGPVQIFSAGYRNSYDLVVTEDGKVFATDNGANINWGGLPENEGDPLLVSNNYLVSEQGGSPLNPTPSGEYVDNRDHLLMVTSDINVYQPGDFYGGHPTPVRANPGDPYQLGAPFPFDPKGAGLYTHFSTDAVAPGFAAVDTFRTKILEPIPPGQPGFNTYAASSLPANWPPVPPSMARPEEADFIAPSLPNTNGPQPMIVTPFPNNSNGIDEYKASNFGGAIKGSLIVGKNEGQLHLINLNEDGSLKSAEFNKFNLNGGNALGIACNSDTEIFPGTIWVATFDNRIMVLTPVDDVICISVDDPEFDPSADYDFDGYSNQDELDNGTDYCSGASVPNDYDRDLVSDLNDLDDDGDGILDEDDPFQLGDPRNLPIINELFTNQRDDRGRANGYLGLGLTGFMNNGAPNPNWLDWLDKGESTPGPPDIYGGTAGAIQVSMTGGSANGMTNTQEKGFQFGLNVGIETGPFTVTSGLIGLSSPGQLYDFDGNGEVGIQMGDGTQSNFIKLVFTSAGLLVSQEINDALQTDSILFPIAEADRPGSNELVELSFDVDPLNGTVKPYVQFGENPRVLVGEITAHGPILQAIQQVEIPLAVGIYGTSNDWLKSFIGVWNFFEVAGEQPYTIRPIADFNQLFNDPDLVLDLADYFNDNDGLDDLVFSVQSNSNPSFETLIEERMLRIDLPNDAVTTQIVVRATDAKGYFIDLSFSITVEQDKKIIRRINAGGAFIPDASGNPDWLANTVSGAFASEYYSVNGGTNSGHSFDPANRHASIPDYISDELYTAIFSKERYNSGGGQMEFEIPLPDGDYLVNIYMGNGFDGTSSVTNRVFNIVIEDEVVESNLDLVARYGHKVGGMAQYPVRITDGFLNIIYINNIQSALVNAIEIWGKPIQTPISVTALGDQLSFSGQELDGSLFINASGGDGALIYKATGLPPGIDIEPTNGTIYGVIADGAIGNSPYRVTVTIDDSDEISSDAVSFNLSWTISPPVEELEWTLKNESTAYAARHENAFVQAGNRFYLMGGRESALTIDVYDYASDTWESLKNINPLPFNHFQAVEYKGLIWVIGAFQSNNFPDEVPTENIWAFDPVGKKWIRGPQIPVGRRRGSAGLVMFNDKFYVVNGNTQGHSGGAVPYFDEYDPATGKWTVLPDSPAARDHFYSVVIGSKMYVVGGRLSGGFGGTFAPMISQVDVYNFSTNTWSTLDPSKNIPTPRAGAITNNYFDKLIIAGGETPVAGPALATTELFDPISQEWQQIASLNFPRHGTQGIVSGKGLYTAAGSPNRGGGNQKNMEFFGFDQPSGKPLVSSELNVDDSLFVKAGEIVPLAINASGGNQGVYINSIKVIGDSLSNFVIKNQQVEHLFIQPNSTLELNLEYVGDELVYNAYLEIIKGDSSKVEVLLLGDGNYEEVNIFLNTGSVNDEMYEGNLYVSEMKFPNYFNSTETSFSTNVAASAMPIYQSHRFGPSVNYSIPVPNGVYTVKTSHNETFFGLNGPAGQPGRRVFSISLEGQVVNSNFDLFVENNNDPVTLVFENIEVVDGILNLDLLASANNATISAISVQNQGRLGEIPIPKIVASTLSGTAPLTVDFNGGESTGQGNLTYLWDFGDGNLSLEPIRIHTFQEPGVYQVTLTVQDENGTASSQSIEINALSPITEFELHLNTGTTDNVSYDGVDFLGDVPFVSYFSQSFTRTNTAVSADPLYQSHRFETTLNYTIPVPNGIYSVKTYHNEFYFGKMVTSTGPGRRVFDIFLEGQLVKDDFDIFIESGNEPTELSFYNIVVSDGMLNLNMTASANSASISGISIELLEEEVILPEAIPHVLITEGEVPLYASFDGSASTGEGQLSYFWVFDEDNQSTEVSPSHTFTTPGLYEVAFTVTDENGRSDTKYIPIEVRAKAADFSLYLNTGTNSTVMFEGDSYAGDTNTPEIYSNSFSRTVTSISSEPLFQSHRFAQVLNYSIPVPNGNYIVQTHHNEFFFGKSTSTTGPGRRVFDIFLEGELVKDDYDIYVEANNEPHSLSFYNISVEDGILNLNMVASANSASISGISITAIDPDVILPVAIATASVVEGEVPLTVQLDGSLSIGQGELLYAWDFGDGGISNEASPLHTFTSPGVFNVSLAITDENGNSNTTSVQVTVNEPAPLLELYLNAGTTADVIYLDTLFLGDANYGSYYTTSSSRTNTAVSTIPLFQSHRFAQELTYSIPVPDGTYTLKTYHNESYFGKTVSTTGPGRRVFDILVEGDLVRSNLDFYLENLNQPFQLEFNEITVADGVLTLTMIASQNNASISGIAIIQTAKATKPGEGAMLRQAQKGTSEVSEEANQDYSSLEFGLYPNPATDEVTMVLDGKASVTTLFIHDMAGRLADRIELREKVSQFVLPLQNYKAGVYVVSFVSDENVIKQMRLIVKK
nr:PKD domain-containing protein [Cytophagales bacterium]